MSRRRSQGEPDFGSDSFLDIIANLVGILIILIVLAGLRASETVELAEEQHADDKPSEETSGADKPTGNDQGTTVSQLPSDLARQQTLQDRRAAQAQAQAEAEAQQQALAEERQRRMAAAAEAARLETLSGQLRTRVAQLRAETDQLDNAPRREALTQARQHQQQTRAALTILEATRNRISDELSQTTSQIAEQSAEIQQLASQHTTFNRKLEELTRVQPADNSLTHHVSPVGQIVTGEEIHFRISGGRISHVPIRELTGILKEKIRQNGNWLLKYNQHQGAIGPVDGYRLEYVVARERLSVVDELRSGRRSIRIAISELVILPDRGLEEEEIMKSLQPDGLVQRHLRVLSPGSPVTLWVYPDSFTDYRQVTAFARENGFVVAGRPLPAGVPITGSNHGSRSVAQ